MTLRDLQRTTVDTIKRHALVLSVGSPRAQTYILTEYLWIEETTETVALQHAIGGAAPSWVGKLLAAQLDDESRHAALLRARLAELTTKPARPAPTLARAKLWWLERAVARYQRAFAAGPIVPALAAAAQFEATGVRIFARHLAVLEATRAADPTTTVVRSILADEQRHARSCAAAVAKLVRDDEREAFDALCDRIATIDRAFGVSLAVRYWVVVAVLAAADRVRKEAA